MAHVLPDHNQKLKPNRRLLLLGGLGAAARIVLLVARRSGGAAQPAAAPAPTTDPTADPGTAGGGQGSTFADNGGQAAQLGNEVTSALGGFSTQMGGLTDALNNLMGEGQTQIADDNNSSAGRADPASPLVINIGTAAAPATTGSGSPAGKPKKTFQSIFKLGDKGGRVHHVYHDAKGAVTRDVAVGPRLATAPAGAPAGKPKKPTTTKPKKPATKPSKKHK